jgi:imidazolonepropionase-like amidohydrolase
MDGEYAIKVEKGEIVSVDAQKGARLDNGVKQIDVKGKYICPGLIDAHVHVCAVPGVAVSLL